MYGYRNKGQGDVEMDKASGGRVKGAAGGRYNRVLKMERPNILEMLMIGLFKYNFKNINIEAS